MTAEVLETPGGLTSLHGDGLLHFEAREKPPVAPRRGELRMGILR
jgi:hypothetical protein